MRVVLLFSVRGTAVARAFIGMRFHCSFVANLCHSVYLHACTTLLNWSFVCVYACTTLPNWSFVCVYACTTLLNWSFVIVIHSHCFAIANFPDCFFVYCAILVAALSTTDVTLCHVITYRRYNDKTAQATVQMNRRAVLKRWWTSLQGESFTVLSTASLFISIEACPVLLLSPFI